MSLRLAPDDLFAHRFGVRAQFRLGVEEELFLVDARSHEVACCTDDVLASCVRDGTRGAVLGEMCDGVIELVTPVCVTADDAVDALGRLRRTVRRDAAATVMGSGVHPTAPFGEVPHRGSRHYAAVAAETRGVLRQSACCGLHGHVGMPDAETAIAAYNGMRRWVPLLQALGANSPFWHGRDSGLASCPTVRFHDLRRKRAARDSTSSAPHARSRSARTRASSSPSGRSSSSPRAGRSRTRCVRCAPPGFDLVLAAAAVARAPSVAIPALEDVIQSVS